MGALGTGSTATVGSGSGTAMADLDAVIVPAMDASARFVAVEGGVQFTCALDDLGSVWCWGRNEAGQLGLDSDSLSLHPEEVLAPVDLGATAESISVGPYHSCAVLTGGSVRCWGLDHRGSLGVGFSGQSLGSATSPMASVPAVDLGTDRVAVEVSAGGQHTCVLLDDASVVCWGANSFGQLGVGDQVERGSTPDSMGDALVAVDLPAGVVSLSSGGEHTCAALVDGTLHCWGLNDFGQAHVIVDIMGWFAAGSDLETRSPVRVLDTRDGSAIGPDGELWLRIAGAAGLPNGMRAVAMNLTATSTSGAGGYVTVFPCGPRPVTSSLNFSSAPTVANAVIAPVSADGMVCFHVVGSAHLIADVSGWVR